MESAPGQPAEDLPEDDTEEMDVPAAPSTEEADVLWSEEDDGVTDPLIRAEPAAPPPPERPRPGWPLALTGLALTIALALAVAWVGSLVD
jgi:hypothetical protein